ncbi:hypothetical protein, partial [Peterkaempfera griseoplana]|uniref:hypothetical protein n=1 Tax=Peterkaempfera griseoplana TaxID=66896 RepID=UPI0006E260B7
MPAPHSTEEAPTATTLPEPRAHEAGPAGGGDSRPSTRDNLRSYASQGGFTLSPETSPWYAAAAAVTTAEEARAASTALAELRGRDLPALREAAPRIAETTPLAEPATAAEFSATVELLARVEETLRTLHVQAYEADLDALAAATAGGPALTGPRRALRKQAKRLSVSAWARRATRHTALTQAAAVRAAWQEAAPDTTPAPPSDGELLGGILQHLQGMETSLRELGRLLPDHDADHLPLAELAELL